MDEAAGFVSKARPVVADLRPFAKDASEGLEDLTHVSAGLDHDTEVVTTYLTPIAAFFYNTSSVFGAGDPQGGNIRGHVVARAPDGTHALPGGDPGYAPGPEGGVVPGKPRYEVTPIPPYVPGSPDYNDRSHADPNAGSPDIRDTHQAGGN
jgi:phospholipid/cholesterol/gamma-HCH transport system substrate-binding protein